MMVIYSKDAIRDLEDIFEYIYNRSTYYDRAYNYVEKLKLRGENIAIFPYAGKSQHEMQQDTYSVVFDKNYLIFYTIHEDHIFITRILHTKRDHLDILS